MLLLKDSLLATEYDKVLEEVEHRCSSLKELLARMKTELKCSSLKFHHTTKVPCAVEVCPVSYVILVTM